MKHLKCYTIIGIIFVLITGTLAHFLYDWSGRNSIVGLFTPVNESVWEHMKLLLFPMLLYAVFMTLKLRKDYTCIASALCAGILTGTFLIPVLYYAYTFLLGKNFFVLDLVTFIISVLVAFGLSFWLAKSCGTQAYTCVLCFLVCIVLLCFLVFTYRPPEFSIFLDPTER